MGVEGDEVRNGGWAIGWAAPIAARPCVKNDSSYFCGKGWFDTGLVSLCLLIAALSAFRTGSLTRRTSVLVSPLTGESLSLACPRESNQREGHPDIRPRLRRGSLLPSPLQGHATKGHPWPIVALATSMSLNPLRGDSTRPPEGDFGVVCAIAALKSKKTRRRRVRSNHPESCSTNYAPAAPLRCGG